MLHMFRKDKGINAVDAEGDMKTRKSTKDTRSDYQSRAFVISNSHVYFCISIMIRNFFYLIFIFLNWFTKWLMVKLLWKIFCYSFSKNDFNIFAWTNTERNKQVNVDTGGRGVLKNYNYLTVNQNSLVSNR